MDSAVSRRGSDSKREREPQTDWANDALKRRNGEDDRTRPFSWPRTFADRLDQAFAWEEPEAEDEEQREGGRDDQGDRQGEGTDCGPGQEQRYGCGLALPRDSSEQDFHLQSKQYGPGESLGFRVSGSGRYSHSIVPGGFEVMS